MLQKGRPEGRLGMDWTVAAMGQSRGAAGTRNRNGESAEASRKIEQIPGERRGLQDRDETLRTTSWGPAACPIPRPGVCEMWLLLPGFP